MSRLEEFGQGRGRYKRMYADDPELAEHEGKPATLIEGPQRWHGTLAKHWQTGNLGVNIGAKTRRRIEPHHMVEIGEDVKERHQHWKKHGNDRPVDECPNCRAGK